ncbi:MAG: amidohydrolase family protein [Candidatus Hydrogenedentes bacterium]|nr:amidohydrolase family protein [Candidatus Hydrogenedentota bacterium]
MNGSVSVRDRLWQHIAAIRMIDTHEHIPSESSACQSHTSLFSFFEHYVSSDLVSAGMPRESLEAMRKPDSGLSLEERWAILEPYWPFARTTGYGRAMLEYIADLYGVVDINRDTYLDLCQRIKAAHKPGWYRHVLKEKAGIDLSLVITWPRQSVVVDQEFFRAVPILDHYAIVSTRAELEALEKESGYAIQTLPQLMEAQEAALDRFAGQGIAGVKIFLAYRRTLLFERAPQSAAARVFDRVWLSQTQDLAFEDLKPLQDFMTRRLIGLAAERGLPIQIHTGLQEGNGNYIENSRPTLLSNLFMEFSDARFDVFHAGYPYSGEVAVLSKMFPNVYADLCWIHAVSPLAATRILGEWLEVIPSNKIFAAGGDSNYVEGAYEHCKIARRVAHEVLSQKVEGGYLSEEEARWLADRILRENAASLFRLG